jgi:hypothetical protein
MTASCHSLVAGLLLSVSMLANAQTQSSLGIAKSESTATPRLEPFSALPEPRANAYNAPLPGAVFPGTEGLKLPPPPAGDTSPTIAILGDLASPPPSVGTSTGKYLKMAVAQLNLLRPEVVLSVGNLVPGLTRDGAQYVRQVQAVRSVLDTLEMPWYPCAGVQDVSSGTRIPGDRRFEQLYQRYQGPLYYSLDTGTVHVIVLNSEETLGKTAGGSGGEGIGDGQLSWLKGDLNRVFEAAGKRPQWILVLVHRPLWRQEDGSAASGGRRNAAAKEAGNWSRVHDVLVQFNRRPIVSVEGVGGDTGAEARGPRVVAVIAGGEQAYSMEPTRDGIRYYVLGSTAAMPRLGEDAAVAIRGFMLLTFDPHEAAAPAGIGSAGGGIAKGGSGAGGMHPAIVELGGEGPAIEALGTIVGEDITTAREREVLDQMAGWDNDVMGVDGFIDDRPPSSPADGKPAPLHLHLNNPLNEKVDLSLRMASTNFLATPSRREAANSYVEGFDLPWELSTRHVIRHLEPGAKDGWNIEVTWPSGEDAGDAPTTTAAATGPATSAPVAAAPAPLPAASQTTGGGVAPPQMEIVMQWSDPRFRVHEIVLKRHIPIAPAARVKIVRQKDALWNGTATGNAFAWDIRGDEPHKLNPTWQMTADGDRFYLRVQVDDAVHSYWPDMTLDPAWGGLACDAVSIEWSRGAASPQRIWLVPFAPKGEQLWTNTGIGAGQSALLRLDPRWGVTADVDTSGTNSYEVTLSIPRSLRRERGGDRAAERHGPRQRSGCPNLAKKLGSGEPRGVGKSRLVRNDFDVW